MSEVGYVRIYRSLIGHPAFRNDGEAMAFAWMVMRASWRPTRVRYKSQSISLKRGQLAVSVRDLAEILDRPKGWVERLLIRLKNETMVETRAETRAGTGVSIITICNYDEYQGGQDSGGTPRETATRQGRDTEQRREKYKKEESSEAIASSERGPAPDLPDEPPDLAADPKPAKPAAKPTSRPKVLMTADWEPAALPASITQLTDRWPPGRLQREVEQFRDYWIDRGERRPGWDRSFHNRIRDIHDRVMRDHRHERHYPSRAEDNGSSTMLRAIAERRAERAAGLRE